MKTIVDMEQAFLKVVVETGAWEAEFQEAFMLPLIQARATQQFLSLSPADRARLKVADPKLYKELTNNVETLLKRMKAAGQPLLAPALAGQRPDQMADEETESAGLAEPEELSTEPGVT